MLSIIMPVLDQYAMTAECIQAVREHTQNYEVMTSLN